MKITTTGFIFNKDKLLLIFHRKLKKWMHVGGHVEGEEFLDEALIREIKEEVNLNVKIIGSQDNSLRFGQDMVRLQRPFFVHGVDKNGKRKLCVDYVCEVQKPVEVVIQQEEIEKYGWFTKEEVLDLDTFPILKDLAIKAFNEYEKNKCN